MKAEYVVKNNKEEWEDYMRSQEWIDLKDTVAKRDGGLCVFCGETAEACHHITYVDDPIKNDKAENCLSVCGRCHRLIHFGKGKALRDFLSEGLPQEEAPVNEPLEVIIKTVDQLPNKTMLCVRLQDVDNQYKSFTWLWNYGTEKSAKWLHNTIRKICQQSNIKMDELVQWEDLIGTEIVVERSCGTQGSPNTRLVED